MFYNYPIDSSSVASPVSQKGQSERTFPILAFSSRFFLFFPDFFPIFGKFFAVRGGTSSTPLTARRNYGTAVFNIAISDLLCC